LQRYRCKACGLNFTETPPELCAEVGDGVRD
jgi:rubredoxin